MGRIASAFEAQCRIIRTAIPLPMVPRLVAASVLLAALLAAILTALPVRMVRLPAEVAAALRWRR